MPLLAEVPARSTPRAPSAPVVFSPALAHYVVGAGAVLTKRMEKEGPSVQTLKGAASLIRLAGNHTHQNKMDMLVRVLLKNQPQVARPESLQAAMKQSFQAYQQYHPGAMMPDLSRIAAMTPAQSATAAEYVSRVGLTGALRDLSTVLAKTAHARRSLGLRAVGMTPRDAPTLRDGLWNPDYPMHLRHVCSDTTAKKIICNHGAMGGEAALGLAIATLTLACQPFVLTLVNAELPGVSIPLDAACVVFALAPAQAAAAVAGFILAVIAAVQFYEC